MRIFVDNVKGDNFVYQFFKSRGGEKEQEGEEQEQRGEKTEK